MLITSTVEICIQQLGRVEEIVFTALCSYARWTELRLPRHPIFGILYRLSYLRSEWR